MIKCLLFSFFQVVELNTKLLKASANRELESTTVYGKELEDTIRDLK